MTTQAHKVLVKNAKRALESLSKDNSVLMVKVLESLKDVKVYVEDLIWDVNLEMDDDYNDYDDDDQEYKVTEDQ